MDKLSNRDLTIMGVFTNLYDMPVDIQVHDEDTLYIYVGSRLFIIDLVSDDDGYMYAHLMHHGARLDWFVIRIPIPDEQ